MVPLQATYAEGASEKVREGSGVNISEDPGPKASSSLRTSASISKAIVAGRGEIMGTSAGRYSGVSRHRSMRKDFYSRASS